MANINLTENPFEIDIKYYTGGVDSGDIKELTLDPVDSPLYFTYESDTSVYPNNVLYAQMAITPNRRWDTTASVTVDVGDTITINGETFTASTNPTFNEFFSGVAADALIIYNSLVDAINQNVNLNWKYTAELETSGPFPVIIITAKYPSDLYDFIVTDNFANNPSSFVIIQTGVNNNRGMELQGYEYGFFVEIWRLGEEQPWGRFNTSIGDKLIQTLTAPWTSSNQASFDISSYIKPLLTPIQPENQPNYPIFTRITNLIKPYYLKWGEMFNGSYDFATGKPSEDVNDITNFFIRKYYIGESDFRWATFGKHKLNINPAPNTNFWQAYGKNFLGTYSYTTVDIVSDRIPVNISTTETYVRRILRRRNDDFHPVYIYFFNEQQFGQTRNLRLRNTFTHIDGTTTSTTTHLTNAITTSDVYAIDLSLTNLGFTAIDNVNRVLYSTHQVEVFRNASWTNYSTEFEYVWDLNYEPERYLNIWWENSHGTLDTFCFETEDVRSLDVDSTMYQTSLKTNSGNFRNFGVNRVLKNESTISVTITSGWVDKENYEFLQSLLLSNRVWFKLKDLVGFQLTDDSFTIASEAKFMNQINIKNSDWEYNSTDNLHNLTVKFEVAIPENVQIR